MKPRRRPTPKPAFCAVPAHGLISIQRLDPLTGQYVHVFATGPDTAQATVDELNTKPESALHAIYEPFP